jgi:phage anti-repressor protein
MHENGPAFSILYAKFANLIPVIEAEIGGVTVLAVEGNALHKGLGVKKDFTDWAKQQIRRLHMIENRDFSTLPPPPGGASVYWFAFVWAKHVAMMTNTKRGFEVREYFLECERLVQGAPPHQPLHSRPWAECALDERNAEMRMVDMLGKYGNHSLAWWYITDVLCVANFPRHMQPSWRQGKLDLVILSRETSDGE